MKNFRGRESHGREITTKGLEVRLKESENFLVSRPITMGAELSMRSKWKLVGSP